MSDVFTKARRSAVMSRIRGKGNKDTELRLIAVFRANGIAGWRRGRTIRDQGTVISDQWVGAVTSDPGTGDGCRRAGAQKKKVLAALRIRRPQVRLGGDASPYQQPRSFSARPDFVFPRRRLAVFVDGCFWHGCPIHATWPKQNAAFWREKILGNKRRDRLVDRTLRRAGWRVVRVWEHELTRKNEARLLRRLGTLLD